MKKRTMIQFYVEKESSQKLGALIFKLPVISFHSFKNYSITSSSNGSKYFKTGIEHCVSVSVFKRNKLSATEIELHLLMQMSNVNYSCLESLFLHQ
jgi:hypothetical protein